MALEDMTLGDLEKVYDAVKNGELERLQRSMTLHELNESLHFVRLSRVQPKKKTFAIIGSIQPQEEGSVACELSPACYDPETNAFTRIGVREWDVNKKVTPITEFYLDPEGPAEEVDVWAVLPKWIWKDAKEHEEED